MAIPKGYENFQVGDEIQWLYNGVWDGETIGVVVKRDEDGIWFDIFECGESDRDVKWDESYTDHRHWRVVNPGNPLEVL